MPTHIITGDQGDQGDEGDTREADMLESEIPAAPVRRGRKPAKALPEEAVRAPARGKGAKPPAEKSVNVPPIHTAVTELRLVGLTPLIVNNFGQKAVQQILDKQVKKAKTAREAKVPFEDFLGSLYVMPNARIPLQKKLEPGESWKYMKETFGFPASGFKGAAVSACTFVSGVTKTIVRGALHVLGDFVPLKYERLVMRQDVVRVGPFGRRVADIRFRGEFQDWEVMLKIRFNQNLLSLEQIANLFRHAGFGVGVGEWRPEKNGSWGTFDVEGGNVDKS